MTDTEDLEEAVVEAVCEVVELVLVDIIRDTQVLCQHLTKCQDPEASPTCLNNSRVKVLRARTLQEASILKGRIPWV